MQCNLEVVPQCVVLSCILTLYHLHCLYRGCPTYKLYMPVMLLYTQFYPAVMIFITCLYTLINSCTVVIDIIMVARSTITIPLVITVIMT